MNLMDQYYEMTEWADPAKAAATIASRRVRGALAAYRRGDLKLADMRSDELAALNAANATPNPKPQTPNPKPQTPNPKPQTPNPKPQTLNVECHDIDNSFLCQHIANGSVEKLV